MPSLIVHQVEPEIIEALKQRAVRNGRSAETEHREILKNELLNLQKRSFTEVISNMPNVGNDSDFERVQGTKKADDVFA